jgi:hypothetical protein
MAKTSIKIIICDNDVFLSKKDLYIYLSQVVTYLKGSKNPESAPKAKIIEVIAQEILSLN